MDADDITNKLQGFQHWKSKAPKMMSPALEYNGNRKKKEVTWVGRNEHFDQAKKNRRVAWWWTPSKDLMMERLKEWTSNRSMMSPMQSGCSSSYLQLRSYRRMTHGDSKKWKIARSRRLEMMMSHIFNYMSWPIFLNNTTSLWVSK